MSKKDYKTILKDISKNNTLDYLFGYIWCLNSNDLIGMDEAMNLIDYAEELRLKKKGIKP